MADVRTMLSIITLIVNRLNTSIKRHKFAEWIKKWFNYMLFIKDKPDLKTQISWKEKNGKIYTIQNSTQKRARVAILIPDKIDFKGISWQSSG